MKMHVFRQLCPAALGLLLAVPCLAQPTIQPGVDLLQTATASPTIVDFSSNPIPAGFFCPGSPAFTGQISLRGVPATTSPIGIAGGADTIVEHVTAGVFNSAGDATFDVVVRALRLTGVNQLQIQCDEGPTSWRVDSCLCGQQTPSKITARVDQACGCGHANGTLNLSICLTFTRVDTGQTVGPVHQNIVLSIVNMPWCYRAGAGETVVTESFAVDTSCDGVPDLKLPASSNFHPGWSCANLGVDCWTQFASLTHCHDNYTNPGSHDHCVNPVCGDRQ